MYSLRIVTIGILLLLQTACSSTANFSTPQTGATVRIFKSTEYAAPRSEKLTSTSFGNYEFRVDAPGQEPFYGVLPLRFNGSRVALDILFFAPAMFFNLRDAYRYYEFDADQKLVRYRQKPEDNWLIYAPIESHQTRARSKLGEAVAVPR